MLFSPKMFVKLQTLRWAPIILWVLSFGSQPCKANCATCATFAMGAEWGMASVSALTEASGIAASRRNPGVFWTHNDGPRQNIYALDDEGLRLATFFLNVTVGDTEDIAVGPGPAKGQFYLYVGDIGGNVADATSRDSIELIRIPEPTVELGWVDDPHTTDFEGLEHFTLVYPDGSYDAESLMVDPVSGDTLVGTKQDHVTRIYRVNIMTATNGATLPMEFLCSVPFEKASAGDISPDGSQIALRREDDAMLWTRCDNEPIAAALARKGWRIPIVGPPAEPNGEGLGFLADGSGYVTIGEGQNPAIYYFQAQCPVAPKFTLSLSNISIVAGGTAQFEAHAAGYPAPVLAWRFKDALIPGQTNSILTLPRVTTSQAGQYEVIASNAVGVATNSALLTVRPKPDLRITEVQSSEAPSPGVPTRDWWELTSFESEPVTLSGWRFNDASGGLADAFVLTIDLTIAPRESVVFVEDLTPDQFRTWWGTSNVSSGVQIITYHGSGLGFAAGGDGLRLWNATATDTNDTVASVDFGLAAEGVTFNFDPVTGVFGGKSQLGVNGVVRAVLTSDVGSPGRILPPLVAPALRVMMLGDLVRIEFDAAAGRRYSLQSRTDLGPTAAWEPTGDTLQATNNATAAFERARGSLPRFYRVQVD